MTLQVKNSTILPINDLFDLIQTKLDGKYTYELVDDRWELNLSGPKKCVLINQSPKKACLGECHQNYIRGE